MLMQANHPSPLSRRQSSSLVASDLVVSVNWKWLNKVVYHLPNSSNSSKFKTIFSPNQMTTEETILQVAMPQFGRLYVRIGMRMEIKHQSITAPYHASLCPISGPTSGPTTMSLATRLQIA